MATSRHRRRHRIAGHGPGRCAASRRPPRGRADAASDARARGRAGRRARTTARGPRYSTVPTPSSISPAPRSPEDAGPRLTRRPFARAARRPPARSCARSRRAHSHQVFISGSAVGYYGARGEEPATETTPPGSDFLAECVASGRRSPIRPHRSRVVLVQKRRRARARTAAHCRNWRCRSSCSRVDRPGAAGNSSRGFTWTTGSRW